MPHITLKSIANNPDIDTIHAEDHPKITAALTALNSALTTTPPLPFRPTQGGAAGRSVHSCPAIPAAWGNFLPGSSGSARPLARWIDGVDNYFLRVSACFRGCQNFFAKLAGGGVAGALFSGSSEFSGARRSGGLLKKFNALLL